MRLPEEANKWKSDGRTIDIDLHDPSIHQLGELNGEAGETTARRFVEWLRANEWTVSTEHHGPMRIGGKTSQQDDSIASLELLLLDEFLHLGCVY